MLRTSGLVLSALLLAACGSSGSDSAPAASTSASVEGSNVVVGIYPVQWLVEQMASDGQVSVTSLAAPGVDPHDLELTTAQMTAVQDADLVVLVPGLQPALDDAVKTLDSAKVLDITAGITLLESTDEHAGETADAHGTTDPHVWLDPKNMITMAKALSAKLSVNSDSVVATLEQLDKDFAAGTAQCVSRDLVVSHAAFGYLANAYNFTQWPVSSSPDVEPTPRDIAAIAEFVRSSKVTTVFTEPLIDPGIAQTIASETGAKTAVLDPLENITAGNDYLSVMRANLAAVTAGLGCAS